MNCLLHMDRPATYVSVRLGQPMWLWLCDPDIAVWRARGLEVSTPSAIAESDVSLPPADGARLRRLLRVPRLEDSMGRADSADCPKCGDWRDAPWADCAACGFEWRARPCGDPLGACLCVNPHAGPHKLPPDYAVLTTKRRAAASDR